MAKNTQNNTVLVAYNSPRGVKLVTSKGEAVLINGCPVNKIVDQNGQPTRAKFGLTKIPSAVWADLKKQYAGASFFTCQPPKMFAWEKAKDTLAQVKEQQNQPNGFEQVDAEKAQTEQLDEDKEKNA